MKMIGNTILVTGGTSGIGRALAEAFHDLGNTVIVAGRRQAMLDEVTANRPGMTGVVLDVGDAASVARFGADVRARFPLLNVLVANAGISIEEDLTSDVWDISAAEHIVETNILGVLRTAAAIVPALKQQPNATVMRHRRTSLSSRARIFHPIAPARPSFTPGFSRCATSCAAFPWKCWSFPRLMCRPS